MISKTKILLIALVCISCTPKSISVPSEFEYLSGYWFAENKGFQIFGNGLIEIYSKQADKVVTIYQGKMISCTDNKITASSNKVFHLANISRDDQTYKIDFDGLTYYRLRNTQQPKIDMDNAQYLTQEFLSIFINSLFNDGLEAFYSRYCFILFKDTITKEDFLNSLVWLTDQKLGLQDLSQNTVSIESFTAITGGNGIFIQGYLSNSNLTNLPFRIRLVCNNDEWKAIGMSFQKT